MKSTNAISLSIATLVIFAGGYWYFSSREGNQPPLTSTSSVGAAAQTQFQALVSQLQPITFNTAIFTDTKFTSLVDLTTPVAAETSGRTDPFAPLAGSIAGH